MPLPKSLTTVTALSKTLAAILFIILPFLGFFLGMQYQKGIAGQNNINTTINHTPSISPPFTACTDDAKLCSDGSSVGREGPNCEFATCPGENPNGQNANIQTLCEQSGGTWLEEHNECEAASGGLDEAACSELGGTVIECASACRHDPSAQGCIEVCINVCKF